MENQIQDDANLSTNEKNGLLSACSIGRYSAEYWGNYFLSNPTQSLVKPLFFIKLKKWMRIVIADIGGGIVGIPTGPWGILFGAIGTSVATWATL